MFFKKREKTKGRVICPISVILEIMQDAVDGDEGSAQFDIRLDSNEHKVGFTSDFNIIRGFFDPIFYLNEQKFGTFEQFKSEAVLDGKIFAERTDSVEVVDVDEGQNLVKFPWYTKFENYVV